MKKKREKAQKTLNKINQIEDKIPLAMFFQRKVEDGKLGSWQLKEISQFFKDKGLTDLEYIDKYEELLKLY